MAESPLRSSHPPSHSYHIEEKTINVHDMGDDFHSNDIISLPSPSPSPSLSPSSSPLSFPYFLSPSSPLIFLFPYTFCHPLRSFPFLFISQLTFHLLAFVVSTSPHGGNPGAIVALSIVFLLWQLFAYFFFLIRCFQSILQDELSTFSAFSFYLSTLLLYGFIFECCYYISPSSAFYFESSYLSYDSASPFSLWILFQYFSVQTALTNAIGDILPTVFMTKLLATTEMLVALMFVVGVFAMVMGSEKREEDNLGTETNIWNGNEEEKKGRRDVDSSPRSPRDSSVIISHVFPPSLSSRLPSFLSRLISHLIRLTYHYCLPLIILMQAILFLLLYALNPTIQTISLSSSSSVTDSFSIFFAFVIEIFQLSLMIIIPLSFSSSMSHLHYINPTFIIQSYLSINIIYGSIYEITFFIIGSSSWRLPDSSPTLLNLFGYFLYFSFGCITFTDYGDVFPIHPVPQLIATIQMLTGIAFNVMILGAAFKGMVVWKGQKGKYKEGRRENNNNNNNQNNKSNEENKDENTLSSRFGYNSPLHPPYSSDPPSPPSSMRLRSDTIDQMDRAMNRPSIIMMGNRNHLSLMMMENEKNNNFNSKGRRGSGNVGVGVGVEEGVEEEDEERDEDEHRHENQNQNDDHANK